MKEKELYFTYSSETNGNAVSPFKRRLWRLVDQYLFRPSPFFMKGWRVWLLRKFGAKIGVGCNISQRAHIYSPWWLEIGNVSGIDDDCLIIGKVKIGDYVSIGCNSKLIGGGHDIYKRDMPVELGIIEIGNGAFIGAGAYINMGVTIGEMAVVSANSSIYKKVKPNTVVAAKPGPLFDFPRLSDEEYAKYRYNYK